MPSRKPKLKPVEPRPDLTVSAVVTVFVHEGGCAEVVIRVDLEGQTGLVEHMTPFTGKLNIAGAALRRVVIGAISGSEMVGPPSDYLALAAKAGRA